MTSHENYSPRWSVNKSIGIGDLMVVVAVIGGLFTQWFTLNARVEKLERDNAQVMQMGPVLNKMQTTLDLLNQRLQDYPLHRHVQTYTGAQHDHLVYPNGMVDSVPSDRKSEVDYEKSAKK